MNRIVNRVVIGTLMAVSLGVAGQSLASGKLDCSYMKDGKSTQKVVSTSSECTKLGGKIVTAKPAASAAATTAAPKSVAK